MLWVLLVSGGDVVREAFGARVRIVPDEGMFDDSFIDTWTDMAADERASARADLWRQIERDGVWGFVAEREFAGRWIHVTSCWAFVGAPSESELDDALAEARDAFQDSMGPCQPSARPFLHTCT